MNAYNAVKTVLYGISFEVGGQVHEGDALVAEEDGARQVSATFISAIEYPITITVPWSAKLVHTFIAYVMTVSTKYSCGLTFIP